MLPFHDLGNLSGSDILAEVSKYNYVKAQVRDRSSGFAVQN